MERKQFSLEEKQKILTKTKSKCAHCGKKLTVKSMTIEHIYPISKGGDNSEYNILPLCEACNKHKSNFIYHLDYYPYINIDLVELYWAKLLKSVYSKENKDIFGSLIRQVYLINNKKIEDGLKNKSVIERKRIVNTIGKPANIVKLMEGDITEDVLEMLSSMVYTCEEYPDISKFKINKYVLFELMRKGSIYGIFVDNKVVGTVLYINIKELKIVVDNGYLDKLHDMGFKEIYIPLLIGIKDRYKRLYQALINLEDEFNLYTENIILHKLSSRREYTSLLMHNVEACRFEVPNVDSLLMYDGELIRDIGLIVDLGLSKVQTDAIEYCTKHKNRLDELLKIIEESEKKEDN